MTKGGVGNDVRYFQPEVLKFCFVFALEEKKNMFFSGGN